MTIEELKIIISAETEGIKKAVSEVKTQVNNLDKVTKSSMKTLQSTVNKTTNNITNSFKKMVKGILASVSLIALVKLGKEALEYASNIEEVQNVVDVSFGDMAEEVNQFAKTSAASFGMSELMAKKTASTFMAMSNGMGVARQAGKTMSLQLTALSGDMASFYNVSQEIADTALKSVFTGETESLKKFGIVLTEANLKSYAMSQGIKKQYSEMSQAEKVALRYNYVMQATANAQGDFARTSNSWANQIRILKLNFQQLMGVLGQILKNVLLPVIQALNTIINLLISAANAVAKTFGGSGLTFKGASETIGGVGDSAGDLADNLGEADKQAKALNKTIAGFDELNTLSSKDTGGTDTGASGGIGDIALSEPYQFEQLNKQEGEIKKSLDEYLNAFNNFINKINEAFKKYQDTALEIGKNAAETINKVFAGIDWAKIGETVGNGTNLVINALHGFAVELDWKQIGFDIATSLANYLGTVDWKKAGTTLAEYLNGVLDAVNGVLDNTELVDNLITAFTDFINGFIDTFDPSKLTTAIAKLATVLTKFVKEAILLIDWDALRKDVNEGIKGLFSTPESTAIFGTAFGLLGISAASNLVQSFLNYDIGQKIKTGLTNSLEIAKDVVRIWSDRINKDISAVNTIIGSNSKGFKLFGEIVSNVFASPVAKITLFIGLIATVIAALVTLYNKSETFRNYVQTIWGILQSIFSDIGNMLKDLWENHILPLWNELQPIFISIGDMFKDLWDVISTVVGWIVGVIGGALLTGVVSAFKKIIEIITNAIASITDVVTGIIQFVKGIINLDFQQIINGLTNILQGLISFVTNTFKISWRVAWEGVIGAFRGLFSALPNYVKAPINSVIGFINKMLYGITNGINTVIRKINTLSWKVPDWVPLIGGQQWGFNFRTFTAYQIPYLANGGVIKSPTLAMAGEYPGASNNPEIVTPEKLLTEIIDRGNDDIITAFAQMTAQLISSIEGISTEVKIGDDVIAKSAARGNKAQLLKTGKPYFA